jgi:succinoglycan biosynthesis protein ExoU
MNRVTIIIAAYNAEGDITRAVHSALSQSEPVSVIVVDDASTDNTASAAEAAAAGHPHFRLIRLEQNSGPAAARNAALNIAEGEWVAPLDADDYMLPNRIRDLLAKVKASGADLMADDILRVAPGEPPSAGRTHWRRGPIGLVEMDLASFARQNIARVTGPGREIGYLKPLMRREFLARHGLRYREDMRLGEDYDLYARAIAAGARFVVTDACGYVAVTQKGSLSHRRRVEDVARLIRTDTELLDDPARTPGERSALISHRRQFEFFDTWNRLVETGRQRGPIAGLRVLCSRPEFMPGLIGKSIGTGFGRLASGWGRD